MSQNSTEKIELDGIAGRLGHHSLINAIILAAIDDLGYDALVDEGVLNWITEPADTEYNIDEIKKWIDHMPFKKNGTRDARPAMRRVMEGLDARDIGITTEVDVHFDQIALDVISEPTDGELAELETELDNIKWELK